MHGHGATDAQRLGRDRARRAGSAAVTISFQAIDFDSKASVGAPISVSVTGTSASATFLLPSSYAGKNITVIATAGAEAAGKIPGAATMTASSKTAVGQFKMDAVAAFGACTFASGKTCGAGVQLRAAPVCRNTVCGANTLETNTLRCLAAGDALPATSKPCFAPCEDTSQWVCKDGSDFVKCAPSLWSACSKACGGGKQTRTCTSPAPGKRSDIS